MLTKSKKSRKCASDKLSILGESLRDICVGSRRLSCDAKMALDDSRVLELLIKVPVENLLLKCGVCEVLTILDSTCFVLMVEIVVLCYLLTVGREKINSRSPE